MSGFEPLKGVRDLNATFDDYRPKKWRENHYESDSPQTRTYNDSVTSICEEPIGCHVENNIERSGMNGFHAAPHPMKSASFNPRGHHNELGYSRLDEIAKAISTLTYGQMLELSESMWKANSQSSGITESELPKVLYRWSKSRSIEN